jgi:hypothetical protein
MVPFDRFAVVLDASTMFPMLVRDVLSAAVEAAFPDALVKADLPESPTDDFVMDLVDLNEKRAVAAFRELRARKKKPPMDSAELIRRLHDGGLVQTSLGLNTSDVDRLATTYAVGWRKRSGSPLGRE